LRIQVRINSIDRYYPETFTSFNIFYCREIKPILLSFCFVATNNNIPLRPPPTSSSSSTTSSSSNQVTVGTCVSKSTNNGNGLRKDKTTRMRTVLNEKQLLTLRTCYSANPRPDALMKEQLVDMTQLSPRVIRVWFQNKRTNFKKNRISMWR
jgi:hypothetical protein